MVMPIGDMIAAGGQTANNRMNQVIDIYQFFKSIGDEQKMNAAIADFRNIPNIDPKTLQYAAQKMGLQPDVLAGNQRTDQVNALRQMQNIADKGGLDDASIAANQQAGMAAARQNQANQQSVSNSLARRGLSAGSGAQLAARGASNQASYNTNAMVNGQNAADAQMRALNAINASGRLAGDLASAEEERAMANRDARMGIDRFNVNARNQASRFNSGALMDAANYNTGLSKDKINPQGNAGINYRNEQTGYARDFGNRQQAQGQTLGNFVDFGMGGKKK